jgi:3'(2'), 5'-bisphosphate nucleotidase
MRGLSVSASFSALDRVLEIARDAGASAMAHYRQGGCVDLKDDGSPVTAADRAAHAVIEARLGAWDADVPIVSEERDVPEYAERAAWRRFWLVDPLDGTKEFIAGNGEFTVNLALIEDGDPTLGVIVAPALDVAYFAGRSLGSWRVAGNAAPMRLAPLVAPQAPLRVVESRSHPSARLEAFMASLGAVERIRLGSSLKFCRVAEGTADVYARLGPVREWDVAAGDCIYRNARPGEGQVCAAYNQPTLTVPEFIIGVRSACRRAPNRQMV